LNEASISSPAGNRDQNERILHDRLDNRALDSRDAAIERGEVNPTSTLPSEQVTRDLK